MEGTAVATMNPGNVQPPYVNTTDKELNVPSGADSDLGTSQAPSLKEIVVPANGADAHDSHEPDNELEKTPTNLATNGGEIVYPQGYKLGAILAALCLAVLCVALDNTIIATAIPKITDEFHSINDVGWFASAYLLTTCAFQLFFGRLYTLFNIKWVFLIALLLFEIGSVICGAAPNAIALIVGRAIAGVGGSGIFSGALIILANSAPLDKRPLYTGFIGGTCFSVPH